MGKEDLLICINYTSRLIFFKSLNIIADKTKLLCIFSENNNFQTI